MEHYKSLVFGPSEAYTAGNFVEETFGVPWHHSTCFPMVNGEVEPRFVKETTSWPTEWTVTPSTARLWAQPIEAYRGHVEPLATKVPLHLLVSGRHPSPLDLPPQRGALSDAAAAGGLGTHGRNFEDQKMQHGVI